jgi:N-formylglutamate deformylase
VARFGGQRRVTAFVVRRPTAAALPLLVSIPHSGTQLPAEIAATLASDAMRAQPMTDWHLDKLYDFLPALGVTTLYAVYSRFVVDLNRPPQAQALYPGRFETGLVPERSFQGEAIYAQYPDAETIAARRAQYHAPYHEQLIALLDAARKRFGFAVLVDAHSVASGANLLHGALAEEIYLGNRDGATCGEWLIGLLDAACSERGLRVSRHHPYKGGYITDHYGRREGVEAVQVEMCQRVYMDESAPGEAPAQAQFERARSLLRDVYAQLADAIRRRLG